MLPWLISRRIGNLFPLLAIIKTEKVDYDSAAERLRKEMLRLAEDHASNVAQSHAVRVSAVRDREQLHGAGQSDYFASRIYAQRQPSQQKRVEPSGYRDGNDIDQNHQSERSIEPRGFGVPSLSQTDSHGSFADARGSNISSKKSLIEPEPKLRHQQPQVLQSPQQPKDRVDDLMTEEGIRRQEDKLRQLRSRVLQSSGGSTVQSRGDMYPQNASSDAIAQQEQRRGRHADDLLAGFEPPAYAKRLYEESRADRLGSKLSVDGHPISSADYLEKWLRNEVGEEDGTLLSPPRAKGLVPSASQRSVASSVLSADDEKRERLRPRDALDLEVSASPSGNRRQLYVGHEPTEDPALRSRSSHQVLRQEGSPHSQAQPPPGGGARGEYVYEKNFDPQQRRRGKGGVEGRDVYGRGRNQMEEETEFDRQPRRRAAGGWEYESDPYIQQGGPYQQQRQQQGMPPYGIPNQMMGPPYGMGMLPFGYGGAYGMMPQQQPPYPMPQQSFFPPYGGMQNPYGHPPLAQGYPPMQAAMQPQQSPLGMIGQQGPPQQEAGYLRELQQLADQLEKENAQLAVAGAPRAGAGVGSGPNQEAQKGNPEGTVSGESSIPSYLQGQGEGGRRLNRAELKHRDEMRQMQFEMEKLKQSQALDELKSELERRKAAKKAENDHEVRLEVHLLVTYSVIFCVVFMTCIAVCTH